MDSVGTRCSSEQLGSDERYAAGEPPSSTGDKVRGASARRQIQAVVGRGSPMPKTDSEPHQTPEDVTLRGKAITPRLLRSCDCNQ